MHGLTQTFLPSALAAVVYLSSSSWAHSWVEQLDVVGSNGTFIGNPGYCRGFVPRTAPGFNDASMVNLIPPDARPQGNQILPTDPICKASQQQQTQTSGYGRLQASAGSMLALRYQENGHVTLPQNQLGKPTNRGTVYIYGTIQPKSDDTLLAIHKVWNTAGTGGDKRGKLLATQAYDDGQCYQVNGGQISVARQAQFSHEADPLMGTNLWCQNNLALPTDAPTGKPYTLYWVWDWPTAPKVDPGLPNGKEEIYTTCMDIDVIAKVADSKINFIKGQSLNSAAVASYFNSMAAAPSTSSIASASASAIAPASHATPIVSSFAAVATTTVIRTVTATVQPSSTALQQSPTNSVSTTTKSIIAAVPTTMRTMSSAIQPPASPSPLTISSSSSSPSSEFTTSAAASPSALAASSDTCSGPQKRSRLFGSVVMP